MPENPTIRQLPRNLIETILKDPGFVQMFEDMMRGVGVTLPENIAIAQDTADQALIGTQQADVMPPEPEPATQATDWLEIIYPLGHTVMRRDLANPADILGFGEWTLICEGEFVVGYKAGDPNFGTVNTTGGALTATVDPHPDHTHDVTTNVNTGTVDVENTTTDVTVLTTPITNNTVTSTGVDNPATELIHAAISILPPYRVMAVWERTA